MIFASATRRAGAPVLSISVCIKLREFCIKMQLPSSRGVHGVERRPRILVRYAGYAGNHRNRDRAQSRRRGDLDARTGADGHDFEPVVPEIVRRGERAWRFIFPHAPVRPVTINSGMSMRAWYDILGFDRGAARGCGRLSRHRPRGARPDRAGTRARHRAGTHGARRLLAGGCGVPVFAGCAIRSGSRD